MKTAKTILIFAILSILITASGCTTNLDDNEQEKNPYEGKKILFIDSYHEGYEWSDGITRGISSVLEGKGTVLKIHRMDTKNNPEEEFKKNAALEAKSVIEEFNPDVVIASDDNAFKYLIMPYYKDADLPFVFCGVNWDVSSYDAPYSNTAGMVEVVLLDKSVNEVKPYADGDKVGFIAVDTLSEHKNAEYYVKYLGLNLIESKYVSDFEEWKQELISLQEEVDIIIIGIVESIQGFDETAAEAFILENINVPVVVEHDWMIQYGLLSYSKIAEEQGEYAAETSLRIIDGENPSDIPVISNKKGKLALNIKMADKLGIIFNPNLIKNADVIKEN
jgi:ABC-type uncharacterized transport system substrate-binding protein